MAGWLPLFKSAPENRVLTAEGGSLVLSGSDITMTISPSRAPFSPEVVAERLAEDPDYYRRMASHLASELGFAVRKLEGQTGNSVEIIRGELIRLQEGFAQLSQNITGAAFEQA